VDAGASRVLNLQYLTVLLDGKGQYPALNRVIDRRKKCSFNRRLIPETVQAKYAAQFEHNDRSSDEHWPPVSGYEAGVSEVSPGFCRFGLQRRGGLPGAILEVLCDPDLGNRREDEAS